MCIRDRPHTRRFLGDSLDARLLSRCAPASLQMRANAVFAPILLLLNMLPGARGFSLAPVAPLMRETHIRQRPVVEPAKLLHTGRTSRRIVMQVAEPPACASARPSVHHSVPLPASPLRPPVPRTASPVGEVAGVWMAPSSLSCSPPALSAAQSPARAHAAPMLAAPPAQFRALPSLALHPPFCHADASAMLPRPRRALLTDWPWWTRCELAPPGCIPCRLLQSHLQSCSPALERCLASSGA